MTTEQKVQIAAEIKRLSEISSQSKVSNKAGVSSATISHMINKKWEQITDDMWRKVKVKLRIELDWRTAYTTNLNYIHKHIVKAHEQSISFAISHDAGAGKSHTYKMYAASHANVIYIECRTFWKSKSYAKELVTACGLEDYGTTEELLERFIDYLSGLERPLLIIDQLDKLKDPSMDFFLDMYNMLEGHCGFVLSGVPALEKRIERGVKNKRTGYYEIWSRIGRKFLKLKPLTLADVSAICHANGVNDDEVIAHIFNTSEGDLRRVKKDILKEFLTVSKAA